MNTPISLNPTTSNSSQRETHRGWIPVSSSVPPFLESPDSGDDGRGRGGYVCFACGRSTGLGKPFVCVSRLRPELSERNARRKGDAEASLQVCIPCALMAAHHELNWKHKPKLLHSEIHGFYLYARSLAQGIARIKSDTLAPWEALRQDSLAQIPYLLLADTAGIMGGHHNKNPICIMSYDQCYGCGQTIDYGLPHILIDIGVHVETPRCMDMVNRLLVAKYCEICSGELYPLKWQ